MNNIPTFLYFGLMILTIGCITIYHIVVKINNTKITLAEMKEDETKCSHNYVVMERIEGENDDCRTITYISRCEKCGKIDSYTEEI
jgi:hypothetical protein